MTATTLSNTGSLPLHSGVSFIMKGSITDLYVYILQYYIMWLCALSLKVLQNVRGPQLIDHQHFVTNIYLLFFV